MKQTLFWLRLEGAVIFIISLLVYGVASGNWWVFILLFFVPDIAMVGYLINNRFGAWKYNAAHSLVLPLLLTAFGYLYEQDWAVTLGLIWLAHIGLDRALGFGLKDEKGFHYTHLGKIGK